MMAQMAFRLMYQKSQHQVAFPLNTYRLLVQYPSLQFGHQLLYVVQALRWRGNTKMVGYLRLNQRRREACEGLEGESTRNKRDGFELRLKLRFFATLILLESLRKCK